MDVMTRLSFGFLTSGISVFCIPASVSPDGERIYRRRL